MGCGSVGQHGSAAAAFPSGEGGRAQRGRMRSFPLARLWSQSGTSVRNAFPFGEGGRAQRGRMKSFPLARLWSQSGTSVRNAFPSGEGGRAQRGRMRSFPPCGLARFHGVARICRFHRGMRCIPPGNSRFFFFLLIDPLCCAGLPPGPAQGLTPPLHPRKELRPLTRFRFALHAACLICGNAGGARCGCRQTAPAARISPG